MSNNINKKDLKSSRLFISFKIINILSTLSIHIILFFMLNLIPHEIISIDWKKNHLLTRKTINQFSKGMDIINLIPPAGKKNKKIKEIKSGDKTKTTQLFEEKYKPKTKPKIKINFKKIETLAKKLIIQKENISIDKKELSKNIAFISHLNTKRGIRSITEKSLLSSNFKNELTGTATEPQPEPVKEFANEPAKAINTPGAVEPKIIKNEIITVRKNPVIPSTPKDIEIYKNIVKNEEVLAPVEKKEKGLPRITPELEKVIKKEAIVQNLKIGLEKGIVETGIKDISGNKDPDSFDPRGAKELTKAYQRLVKEKIDINKETNVQVPKIEKTDNRIRMARSIAQGGGLKQHIKINNNLKTELKPIKVQDISSNAASVADIPSKISPELDKSIKKLSREHKIKPGSENGIFKNKIKDFPGYDEPVDFAPKGTKDLSKSYNRVIEQKIETNKEVSIKTPEIKKIEVKENKAIISKAKGLKQIVNMDAPDAKNEIKQMKLSFTPEVVSTNEGD
ncbi:hypothetical protein HY745_04205, partial [Candidatus Desantisbacteria bacterium]|nr:hypothetical protein [Candidatus Desantisbacteria bacterium]